MIRFALCGLGKIGTVHLDNLQSLRGCRVTAVYDLRHEPCALAAARHGVRVHTQLSHLIRDPEVDAVVVATAAETHRDITLAALAAGKHVFVEKPLAARLVDAEAIAAAARVAALEGQVVQVGFCERFNPQYLEAKRVVASGALGKPRAIFSSRLAPYDLADPSWELGALDTAVHNLDLILWLLGAQPIAVSAMGVSLDPGTGIPHIVSTQLRFADGTLASDQMAWVRGSAHPLRQCARSRMTLIGDAGVFDVDLSQRPNWLATDVDFRMADTVILGGPDYFGCLKLQFEAFLRSIEEGLPSAVPAGDGLRVERVALAALRSLRSGGSEVMLAGGEAA